MPTTYELKFKDGGVWMENMAFLDLIKELFHLGVDAETLFVEDGIQFTLKKSDD